MLRLRQMVQGATDRNHIQRMRLQFQRIQIRNLVSHTTVNFLAD